MRDLQAIIEDNNKSVEAFHRNREAATKAWHATLIQRLNALSNA